MKILMLGWEYPPKVSGGLGIASQGLARALATAGHDVTFLLPNSTESHDEAVLLEGASDIQPKRKTRQVQETPEKVRMVRELGVRLIPYVGPETFWSDSSEVREAKTLTYSESIELLDKIKLTGKYGAQLMDEIHKYAYLTLHFAMDHEYDLVHCHDWMTFKAGQTLQEQLNIPLVLHFHSTESERNGLHPLEAIEDIERMAAAQADQVIAVSEKTARLISDRYHIPNDKIDVLPNGYTASQLQATRKAGKSKKIGFIGRITHQKNPKKFIDIARLLTSTRPDVSFLIIGDGDQMETMRNQVRNQNLESITELTGFLSHEETLERLTELDLLLVPSHQEPFGLVPLEAIRAGVPVVCGQGAGIQEFVPSIRAIPTWNDHLWLSAIKGLLDDAAYRNEYASQCLDESKELTWTRVAQQMTAYYEQLNRA